MRILHLLNHTRRLNGHVHAAVDLACAQTRMGHQAAIGSEGGDFQHILAANGVDELSVSHARKPPGVFFSIRQLYRVARTWKPDVIHAHMVTSAVLAKPVCSMLGIPLVTTVHNEFQKSAVLMGLGDRVIAVSTAVGDSMVDRGIRRSQIDVILNGTIGSARLAGRDRSPASLPSPAVVFVGGIHPRKGVANLLSAFETVHAKFPTAWLHIVGGDGGSGWLQKYKELAAGLGCGQAVTFHGAQDNPVPFLTAADIFVLPSLADPAPLVLSEAREAGCAIIASEVDGIPQMLEMGEAGILCPPGDAPVLAETILSLLVDPPALARWRERSQVNISHMTIARVAAETLECYVAASGRKARKAA